MNLKTTYILFGILVLVLGGLALTQLLGPGSGSANSDFVFPELHAKKKTVDENDIDTVRVAHPDSSKAPTLYFTRDEHSRNWQMEEPQKFRVAQHEVNSLVREVIGATRQKVDTVRDLKEYELDKPNAVVTFTRGDQIWSLNVGKQSQGNDPLVYVTTSSRPKEPVAVKKSSLQAVFKTVNDFRSRNLVSVNVTEITSIELQPAGKKEPLAVEKKEGGRWVFQKPAGFGEAEYEGEPRLSTEKGGKLTGVRPLLDDVTRLQVEGSNDFVADNVGESELKVKYGLAKDNPATLRIVAHSSKKSTDSENKTAVTETLLIGKKVPEEKAEKKDDKKEDKKPEATKPEYYYARLESENNVVKLPAKNIDSLVQAAADPDALRDRDLAHFDRDKVDAIEIENAEGTIKLFKPEGADKWKLWRDKSGADAEESTVRALLDTFDPKKEGKRRVDSFPAEKPEQAGMDKNARLAAVSLWEGGLKKQEKPDAPPELKEPKSPTVRLTVGRQLKDRALVYVLREPTGEKQPTLLLVKDKEQNKESLVDRVTPGPLAYVNRKLPAFPAGEGTQLKTLAVTRGGETVQLKNEKSGELMDWQFEAPKELAKRKADRNAVEDVLRALQFLSPVRVAAEKLAEKQLEAFGLKPPQFQATITATAKDNKEEKLSYSFGKETPDKAGIFAKVEGSDLVYVVPSTVLTPLQAEFQDKTLFAFDVEKVRSMKLSGWKNILGVVQTLDLERKSKNSWVAQVPQGYEAEANVAESFLHTLSGIRAIKFLKGAPKPEYGLDTKNPGLLTIEIFLSEDKEPLKLTVGNLDSAEKAYHTLSGNVKDQTVLVPEEPFKSVLAKPGYFSKTGQ